MSKRSSIILFNLTTLLVLISFIPSNHKGITQPIVASQNSIIPNMNIQQTGYPIGVYANVEIAPDGVIFNYFVENINSEDITSFYLLHDAPEQIDLSLISSPEGWEFSITPYMTIAEDTFAYIYWYLSSSALPDLSIQSGERLKFSYTYAGNFDGYQIADGIWSLSGSLGAETFYSDPLVGQLYNSSMYNAIYNSYGYGLSDIPTIVKGPETCSYGFNDLPSIYEIEELTPITVTEVAENYSKNIKTHGFEQGWSTAGDWGCVPTSLGYSLGWWGEHGVGPSNDTKASQNELQANSGFYNPLNVTDFSSMTDLVEELIRLTNTSSVNGTNLPKIIKGLNEFFKKYNLPLKFNYYWFGIPEEGQSGIPNPDSVIDEFMDNREDVTIIVAYRGASHALTLVGMNRTRDPDCGYKITLLDPASGELIETCMKAQYFDEANGTWTEDDTGDTKYGKIKYKGKWRAMTSMIAISPSDPSAEVEGSTSNDNSSLRLNQGVSLNAGVTTFSYQVSPTPNQGALIDTFAIQTQIQDPDLLDNFLYPKDWKVTISQDNSNNVIVYFHNDLYNGRNVTELTSTGFTFSFTYRGSNVGDGTWYTSHSGLAILDDSVEDTGLIIVPKTDPVEVLSTTTSTPQTSLPSASTESPSNPLDYPLTEFSIFLIISFTSVIVRRRRRFKHRI